MLDHIKKFTGDQNVLFFATLTGLSVWVVAIVTLGLLAIFWIWTHVRICII